MADIFEMLRGEGGECVHACVCVCMRACVRACVLIFKLIILLYSHPIPSTV